MKRQLFVSLFVTSAVLTGVAQEVKVDENNVIEYVYDMENTLGQTYFCRGYSVTDVTGLQVTCSSGDSEKTGIMAADCKVWNVSDTGEFGAETELQVGDIIYAGRNPLSEIINVYVVKRA